MFEYRKGNGFVHRLDPLSKLIWLIVTSVLILVTTNLPFVAVLLVFVVAVHMLSGLPLRKSPLSSRFVLILVVLLALFHGFFTPAGGEVLLSFHWLELTQGGITFGVAISLRLLALLTAASVFTVSTNPAGLVTRMGRYLPYEIGFAFMNAMTSVPSLRRDLSEIVNSQVSRGMRFGGLKGAKSYFPVVAPLISKALEGARCLAYSAESRGLGSCKISCDERMGRGETLFILLPVVLGIAGYLILVWHP